MGVSEKLAYLKGLAEGLALDSESKEGKLFAAVIDVLDEVSEELEELEDDLEDLEEELEDIEDGLDAVSDDLSEVEELLYELEEDDDEDEEDCFMTTGPACEEEIFFDETVLEDGEVVCPNCGEKLEFDLSDLANALDGLCDEEDEEVAEVEEEKKEPEKKAEAKKEPAKKKSSEKKSK